ncbi:hypothetical protein VTL71DRAFT_420 [Oculimacula yallundae]|uniref:Uncharacterized protein n=1 Tax=Oculimacula yallundae TaxID=86028 RepID=A0ABR4D009_9HELO
MLSKKETNQDQDSYSQGESRDATESPKSISDKDLPSEDNDNDDEPSKETTTIPPRNAQHTHTFIFLHGRSDYGSDLSTSFFHSTSSLHPSSTLETLFPTIRFVFPTAPLLRSARLAQEFSESSFAKALDGEEVISQWFDVWDLEEPDGRSAEVGMRSALRESVEHVRGIVREEARKVGWENVVLGGISQGCATALMAILGEGLEVGAFVGWCGWLPFRRDIEAIAGEGGSSVSRDGIAMQVTNILEMPESDDENQTSESTDQPSTADHDEEDFISNFGSLSMNNKARKSNATPMFFGHAKNDETVPYRLGKDISRTMQRLGFEVMFKSYEEGGHWINSDHGVDDMARFLEDVFGLMKEI